MANSVYRKNSFSAGLRRVNINRGLAFGVILLTALIAFEIFNFSTTEYALNDLLGDLEFLGLSWATILAVAFCGIDFAGIARLHTPEEGSGQPNETWYLFGAWLLAATMNAMLTWWGVSLALVDRSSQGVAVIDNQTLLRVVPIFVAVLVWLIRVLIIGTYSTAGTRLLSQRTSSGRRSNMRDDGLSSNSRALGTPAYQKTAQPASNRAFSPRASQAASNNQTAERSDPIYTPVYSASPPRQNTTQPVSQRFSDGSNSSRSLS
jgi:hypothetical protein